MCLDNINRFLEENEMNTIIKPFVIIFCLSFCCSSCFGACPSADLTGDCRVDFNDFAKLAEQWLNDGEPYPILNGMTWVSISDPGVSGHEGFTGEMGKYETTNAQYCEFLNAALASGDITVSDDTVWGANGSNSGADFVSEEYYNLAGVAGYTYNGATNGGAARINYSDGLFTVDSGFESHPVTYASWYGATAFCNYYGYRLPTEWEWKAVAGYNGSYYFGCGDSINNSIANYNGSTHPDGTTAVGAFGTYGYGMCDMAGNVWERTAGGSDLGGSWYNNASSCTVLYSQHYGPYDDCAYYVGFRVCR